ncbi:MAG: hypothetical protein H6686_10285 [Fibrobacteria bacterium]|nr:hypothetical protein [Fibrobacteria bacterium]
MSELSEFKPFLLILPLVRRWLWILIPAVIGGALGTLSLRLDPPRFESFAVLLPTKGQASEGDLFTLASRLGIGGGGGGGDISGIYDEVMRSIPFTNRLAGRRYPIGWGGGTTTLDSLFDLPAVSDTLRHAMALNGVLAGKKGLVWKVQPNGTVRISFQALDPVFASSVVSVVLDELQSYTGEVRTRGTTQKLMITSRNLDSVSHDLEQAESRVAQFQSSNLAMSPGLGVRLARLEREARVLEQVYSTLRQSKATLEVERDSYIPTFQVIEAPRPGLEPAVLPLRKWIAIGVFLGGVLGGLIALLAAVFKGEFRGMVSALDA